MCRPAHGVHGESAEEESHHRAEKDPSQHLGVHQGNLKIIHEVHKTGLRNLHRFSIGKLKHRIAQPQHADAYLFHVGCHQRQCGQCGRANGKPFSRGSGCVSQRIEHVGPPSHLGLQPAHLGISAGIVGNRPIRIGGQGDPQRGEHPHGGNRNAIQPHAQIFGRYHMGYVETDGRQVGEEDGGNNGGHRDHGRDKAGTHAGDDHRGRPCLGTVGNAPRGLIRMRRKVLGTLTDDNACQQAGNDRERQPCPVTEPKQVQNAERGCGNEQRTHVYAPVE